MGRPRKYPLPVETDVRDPQTTVRDPVIATIDSERERVIKERRHRRYISASMPTVCPDCGGNTRQDDGRHVDPVRFTILEYRTCAHCGAKLAAGRDMTEHEKKSLCTRLEAVKEYEESIK